MKNIIVALIAFLPFVTSGAFAQGEKTGTAEKLSVGFTYSPDHSFGKFGGSDRGGGKPNQLSALGFTTGLSVQYEVNNRFALETGLLLSDKASRYEIPNAAPGSLVAGTRYESNSMFLEAPLKGNLYLINGDFKVYLTAGPAASFFLTETRNAKTFYNLAEGDSLGRVAVRTEKGSFGNPTVTLSTFVGAGVAYSLNENLTFRAEPIYRRTFALDLASPFRSYWGAYGLNLRMLVKF